MLIAIFSKSDITRFPFTDHEYFFIVNTHLMPELRRWRGSHILKGIPASACNDESGQIPKIMTSCVATSEYIHHTINDGCCMTLTTLWNSTGTVQLSPVIFKGVIFPDIRKSKMRITAPESVIKSLDSPNATGGLTNRVFGPKRPLYDSSLQAVYLDVAHSVSKSSMELLPYGSVIC